MNFGHGGLAGDVLFAVPTMLSMAQRYGGPIHLHLKRSPQFGFDQINALIPLLATQPNFEQVEVFDEKKHQIDADLDLFRATQIDFSRGCLPRFYFYAYHAWYDLSLPWLSVEPDKAFANTVVVNRTERYRNPRINYKFLDQYMPVFIGMVSEYFEFKAECPNAIYYPTGDFLEAARIVRGCKLFVGNQSACWVIAEALKSPRVLETCLQSPTAIPQGKAGYDAVNQIGFETLITELL